MVVCQIRRMNPCSWISYSIFYIDPPGEAERWGGQVWRMASRVCRPQDRDHWRGEGLLLMTCVNSFIWFLVSTLSSSGESFEDLHRRGFPHRLQHHPHSRPPSGADQVSSSCFSNMDRGDKNTFEHILQGLGSDREVRWVEHAEWGRESAFPGLLTLSLFKSHFHFSRGFFNSSFHFSSGSFKSHFHFSSGSFKSHFHFSSGCFKSQERKVTKVVRHPDFDIGTLKYNFAVLFLESSFDAATHIAPVCLPQVPNIDKLTLVVVNTGHYMVYQRWNFLVLAILWFCPLMYWLSLSLLALRPVQQGELCSQRVGQGQVRFRRQVRVLHQQHHLVGMEVKKSKT